MKPTTSKYIANCEKCQLKRICFADGLNVGDLEKLDALVERKSMIQKETMLYEANEDFRYVYVVRSGLVKVFSILDDGTQTIHGFYLPGDAIGLEGLGSHVYISNAVTLDDTHVCEIPYEDFIALAQVMPKLNSQVFNMMGHEVVNARLHSSVLREKNAEQRLADFILTMSEKFKARGFEHKQFRLNILHRDVANFLNLSVETVSRILSKMQKDNLLSWRQKEVTIYDRSALKTLVENT